MNILRPALRTAEEIGARTLKAAEVLLWGIPEVDEAAIEPETRETGREHSPTFGIFGVDAYDLSTSAHLVIVGVNESPVTGPFGAGNRTLVTALGQAPEMPGVSLHI